MFINVAIGILEINNRILMLKRKKGNFRGYWALPGGKIEDGEHVDEAIIREVFEETGLDVKFANMVGVFSEIIKTNDNSICSTLIYGCKLALEYPHQIEVINYYSQVENNFVKWFTKDDILSLRKSIVHSDLLLLDHCLNANNMKYMKIDCKENNHGDYNWTELVVNG